MLVDYGREFVNVLQLIDVTALAEAASVTSFGASVSHVLRPFSRTAGDLIRGLPIRSCTILYFPPGRYVLDRLMDSLAEVFTVPRGIELFFANEAILRIGPGVTLVIEGTLRAGQQQIFGFNRFEIAGDNLQSGRRIAFPSDTVTWPVGTVRESSSGPLIPCGRVVITSEDVPLVRPEWWGAGRWEATTIQAATASPAGHDSWDAFQGAIDAACLGRAERRLSPIPIVLSGLYQIVRTLEVRPLASPGGAPRPACLVLRGGAGVSGFPTVVRNPLLPVPTPRDPSEVLLRLHPGIDFDIQDVSLRAADNVDGVVEVRCDERDLPGRRGLLRRVTLTGGLEFMLRIVEEGASTARRHFTLDGGALVHIPGIPCRNDIRLDAGPGVMLRISNTGMGAPTVGDRVLELPPQAVDHATCHLIGGAAMLDSLLFHQALGPRPSRDPPRLDEPDGQDVFLGAPAVGSGRASTQLTMLQCESQGWWLLGRHSQPEFARQAVLLGVAHNAVVWDNVQGNLARRNAWATSPTTPWMRNDRIVKGRLPSVVWRGSNGQCVMIGSRLGEWMVLTHPHAIVNVATVFKNGDVGESRRLYLQEDQMIRRADGYVPVQGLPMMRTFDGDMRHVVPILEDGRMMR